MMEVTMMATRIAHHAARDRQRAETIRDRRRRAHAVRSAERAAEQAREAEIELKEAA